MNEREKREREGEEGGVIYSKKYSDRERGRERKTIVSELERKQTKSERVRKKWGERKMEKGKEEGGIGE